MRLPRVAEEHHFRTDDGLDLFYRAWLPATEMHRAVLLFHRGHEHSGRFQELVESLDLPDTAFFAWDSRGCGVSPGERGDARSLGQLESDMEDFLHHLVRAHEVQPENTVVLAHSVAAVVAGLWVLDYAPRLRGLILATPALQVKLYVPLAREGLRAMSALGRMQKVSSYVRGSALTHDPQQARLYDQDPLICKDISTRLLLDLDGGAKRLLRDGGNITVPTQVLVARQDWVVKNQPIRKLFRKLGGVKECKVYKGLSHSIFHEKGREKVAADVRAFLQRCFATAHDPSLEALSAASIERYEWHRAGPPMISLANLFWKVTRGSMKTAGRLSQGVRLGLASGFSSGETLDYVYQNIPRGVSPIGRLIDKGYLQSLGWVCIRQRRQHLRRLLSEAVKLAAEGSRVLRLVDIAGGPGRYLLDMLEETPAEMQVMVRDMDENALQAGRRLAASRHESRITYLRGDAFDPEQLAQLEPIDVAIVSGLYELFPSNQPVVSSLAGLGRAVRPGGYLIYTNQPSHPQIELIAETLTHADGSPWVMRCRGSAEMDYLVGQAGFRKLRTLIDDHGIFSVSLAQRVP